MSPATTSRARVATLFLMLLPACNWGRRGADFPPAVSPQGATVTIRLQGERTTRAGRAGELYAVDPTGATVLTERLVHLRWPSLAVFDIQYLGNDFDVFNGETPSEAKLHRLASVSRFPQGLSGELLARVLAIHKQTTVEEVP